MKEKSRLLLSFYGDDFTGSTDALEFLSRAGIRTVLFIKTPTQEQLNRYPDVQGIGVAGMTRSMEPEAMDVELRAAFAALGSLGASHVHYKVCSTFDSSPAIGSIGKAIDIGYEIFSPRYVPLLVAAPALGRHCVFGNLFARMGIGSNGEIHRLDRHPSMSRHPVTPAHESDLRVHLSKQTSKKIGLLDILEIEKPDVGKMLQKLVKDGSEVILFDAVYNSQMTRIGELLDSIPQTGQPVFSVGSSGIEMALGQYWKEKELLNPPEEWADPGPADPLLVISGSCSPVTSGQIAWAVANGFAELSLDTEALVGENSPALINKYVEAATHFIEQGQSVILHTSSSEDDQRVKRSLALFRKKGLKNHEISSHTARLYGTTLGQIAREVTKRTKLQRMIIAGGDTSSYAARAMGIEAVEMIAPLAPGAPLCKAYAPDSPIDGLEINFKGGQVGGEDYFGLVLQGKIF